MLSFEKQFKGKLKEVFLYITYRCNLKCPHCYIPSKEKKDMSLGVFEDILKRLIDLGATKVTFLGGEPTLHPLLPEFIHIAENEGIDYIRLDTNGSFNPDFLDNEKLRVLDDICFSLDGIDSQTHGAIRTTKNYYSVINNIKKAVALGYVVRVTMTINSLNLSQVKEMISKLGYLGVAVLNLHLTTNSGRTKKNKWLLVEEEDWIDFYQNMKSKVGNYNIRIKIPKRYIRKNGLRLENKITCEAAKNSRLSITPDFKVYSCPLLLDKKRYFAYFRNGEFVYAKNYRDNIIQKNKIEGPVCPLLMQENYKKYKKKKIIPLCVSYKPKL